MLQLALCEACGRRLELASARFLLDPGHSCPHCGGRLAVRAPAAGPAARAHDQITVFVCDSPEEQLFVGQCIKHEPNFRIVGGAEDIAVALVLIGATEPQVVVLDHQLVVGFEPARDFVRVRTRAPGTLIVAYSTRAVEELDERSAPDAYVGKYEPTAALGQTIDRLARAAPSVNAR